ncbi:MAG: prolyl oligopeptidase family serine peptidase [Rhodopirellula sp.]|nr:prolyl oligopeptidase family serine peptidase [Rhodopirellula sp.]
MIRITFVAVFSVSVFLLLSPSRPANAQLFQRKRGEEQSLVVDGRTRNFLVYAPKRQSKSPLPLVFVLHGGGSGTSRQLERFTKFNDVAEREGFITCYPDGYEGNWNDGRGVSFIKAHSENVDDVKFFRAMIDDVSKGLNVDRSRVFATGISNGAFMSHRLAAEASDVFAAVAPIVGGMALPIGKNFKPKYPVSLFVIQGEADPLVPYAGGEVGYKFSRKRGQFLPTTTTIQKYLDRNGIRDTPESKLLPDKDPDDGTITEAKTWPIGEGGSRVQFYSIRNGGHTWPGRPLYAPERLIGKVSHDFDACEEIWKFFKSCPPRELSR